MMSEEISQESLPRYVGGNYRIAETDHLLAWVRFKLGEFPALRSNVDSNDSTYSHDLHGDGDGGNRKRPSANVVPSHPCGNLLHLLSRL